MKITEDDVRHWLIEMAAEEFLEPAPDECPCGLCGTQRCAKHLDPDAEDEPCVPYLKWKEKNDRKKTLQQMREESPRQGLLPL